MAEAQIVRPARRPFEALYDALLDPERCERTMALLLAGYAAVWSLYAALAKSSQDINFDMGEMVAWSHQITLGTPKHPPLGAWLVGAWFSVMPQQDWSYYLFAMILPTAALWIVWRLSARYLPADKRIFGVAWLTLVPFYNLHALRFNANTVLIPFWAATTWWFLRSLETRRAGWAALTGAAAAAAMLGKYWSIFLLAGLALAGLSDPRRSAYFRSPAPWISIAVGALLLAPHVGWLIVHHFSPFTYAEGSHDGTFGMAAMSAVRFIAGDLAYIAAPIVLCLVSARPNAAALRNMLWPSDGARRTIVIAFATPFLLAVLVALAAKVRIVDLWSIAGMTLVPVILLSSPLITISRRDGVRLVAFVTVFPILMAAAAPAIAVIIHRRGVGNYASHYRLIAQAVERAWREKTDAPLRIVGSYGKVVNGIIFYMRGKPMTLDIEHPFETPWVTDNAIRRDGVALVCPVPVGRCTVKLKNYTGHGAAVEDITLARRYFGTLDQPVSYRIVIIPPQR